MNVLIVFAHPEPKSLNGSINKFIVEYLETSGHQVKVSDLYAMNWKASIDSNDNVAAYQNEVFQPTHDSLEAFKNHTQSEDIVAEQEKIIWADIVIFQFPLWWFSMPAILKGWVDRVYAAGFAYAVGEHSENHWGNRYGEGTLAGKRAMLVVTMGGWESHFSARGVNGPIDDILFPIQHGILFYPGFDVLPPYLIHKTNSIDEERFSQIQAELATRLDQLASQPPIAFRKQNAGQYDIPALTLKAEIAPDKTGFSAHIEDE